MLRCSLLAVLTLLLPHYAQAAGPTPQPGKQIEVKRRGAAENPAYNYLLFAPADYEKQDKWPLIVFLHGSGERGDSLDLVRSMVRRRSSMASRSLSSWSFRRRCQGAAAGRRTKWPGWSSKWRSRLRLIPNAST